MFLVHSDSFKIIQYVNEQGLSFLFRLKELSSDFFFFR